jgi:hypothetical protein
MNYTQLQQAILDDTHKSQYVGEPVQRFITQGEQLIAQYLESYNFQAQLLDANRVSVGSSTYNLPVRLTHLRFVKIDGRPLDKVDESNAYLYKDSTVSLVYAQRSKQIIISGNPGTGVAIDIDYMGMPDPLATTPTNTLLDECQQLYIDAASVFVFTRAEDYDSADLSMAKLKSTCAQLNRKSKKLLGGAQAAPVYNTQFRSSY